MSTPPYHLRTNKAVERALFIELLRSIRSKTQDTFNNWTYIGFGGPHMVDFNLISRCFDFKNHISLEPEPWVHSRQLLNSATSNIESIKTTSTEYLRNLSINSSCEDKTVVWLDYTGGPNQWLEHIDETADFIQSLPKPCIVKLSLVTSRPADIRTDHADKVITWLNSNYGDYGPFDSRNTGKHSLYKSAYQILNKRFRDIFSQVDDFSVVCLASYFYCDVSPILTTTFLASGDGEVESTILKEISQSKWPYLNIGWSPPHVIDVPDFTLRERIAVDRLLPTLNASEILSELSVHFDADPTTSEKLLESYISLRQHSPFFHQTVY